MNPETRFQTRVIKWLEKHEQVWCVIFHASGISRTGVPDILACIKGSFVAIEVKTDIGVVSSLQEYHLNKIKEIGGNSYVIKPSNFKEKQEIIKKKWKLKERVE